MSNNVDNIKEAYKCDSACHTEFLLLRVQSKHFTQLLVHFLLARRERIRLLRGIIIGSLSVMAWTKNMYLYRTNSKDLIYDNIA